MNSKPSISFVWQGINGRYGQWKDGLWLAMKHLEKKYEVFYQEPDEEIKGDIIMYWEAPCTTLGKDQENYKRIQSLPNKKILLFAGGPIRKEWVKGFDLVCVESQINKEECDELGIPNITAFGINEEIMKPMAYDIVYDGIHHGTCASWKRQQLVGEALGSSGLVVGRNQESDSYPFDRCKQLGTLVLPEQTPEIIATLLNQSHCCVQTSDFWGGGQRCTLEAMACGIPVICMEDSPKNMEYIKESGFGAIVYPNKESIKVAVEKIKENPLDPQIGVDYVKSKWTSRHYADNLIKAINIVWQK
jgi:glycosyltransferase involved in cell wall biosynthesis